MVKRCLCQRQIVTIVEHPGALAASQGIGFPKSRVVKRDGALLVIARPTGRAFDHVHISQTQRAQQTGNMLKQRLRLFIDGIVGRCHGRQPDACAVSANLGHHGRHDIV